MSDIAPKIRVCSENIHGLKRMYKNIANRGEVTKEIIKNATNEGSYEFFIQNRQCTAKLSYIRNKLTTVYHFL